MPIHTSQNLYPGVNAHLNSYLQNKPDGWMNFHGKHITNIDEYLGRVIPAGYFAVIENSLQISEIESLTGRTKKVAIISDVLIHSTGTAKHAGVSTADTPVLDLPILDTFVSPDLLGSIVIYQVGEGEGLGRAVTRIELLSPANMPGGSHHEQYITKRLATLKGGLRLVEIDYLHEFSPIVPGIPDYSRGEQNAFPYVVVVSDPRPNLEKGRTVVYPSSVDKKLPAVAIPLAGADTLALDFNTIYQHTFETSSYFRLLVDYAEDPPAFDKYTQEDQVKIRALLDSIQHNARLQESD
jgi:hypothetical protein